MAFELTDLVVGWQVLVGIMSIIVVIVLYFSFKYNQEETKRDGAILALIRAFALVMPLIWFIDFLNDPGYGSLGNNWLLTFWMPMALLLLILGYVMKGVDVLVLKKRIYEGIWGGKR